MKRKTELTAQELMILRDEVERKGPNKVVVYLLWLFLGGLGIHRFYLKNPGMGIGMLLTLGGFGIWAFIDVFFIHKRINVLTEEIEEQTILKLF